MYFDALSITARRPTSRPQPASRAGGDAGRTSAEYAGTRVSPIRHNGVVVPGALILVAVLALPALATEPPPTPEAPAEQVIHDTAGLLDAGTIRTVTLVGDRIAEVTGMPLAVYAQHADDPGPDATRQRAEALLADAPGNGVVVLVEQDASGSRAEIAYAVSPDFEALVPADTLDRILTDSVRPVLGASDPNAATIVAVARLLMEVSGELPGGPVRTQAPPSTHRRPDRRSPIRSSTARSTTSPACSSPRRSPPSRRPSIESKSGRRPRSWSTRRSSTPPTPAATERHARALIDQWGVGRRGFDDGLAIFFDFEPGRSSGQFQLYAGPGFAATFLTNSERQQIFENDMLPHLREDDWDGALLAAHGRDRRGRDARKRRAARARRQLNAAVGLIGAPLILAGLVGWGFFHWRRYGKDPVYLDSPSIYVPAPPPGLTAASGAMVMDGKTSRRALTTAMLDLASRGLIGVPRGRAGCSSSAARSASRSGRGPATRSSRLSGRATAGGRWDPAERVAFHGLGLERRFAASSSRTSYLKFGSSSCRLRSGARAIRRRAGLVRGGAEQGRHRWVGRGVLAIVVGRGAGVVGLPDPDERARPRRRGADHRGCILLLLSRSMPAVTMPGAMIRAQLAAYRRTLKKTMEQSRSMDQVVADAGLEWLDTPDQASCGAPHSDCRTRSRRSSSGVSTTSRTGAPPRPERTYRRGTAVRAAGVSPTRGGGGGVFSSSGVPNLGGMMAALGTIGNSPASSGSGGGGGFSGGGSGGGGGGAGGGF